MLKNKILSKQSSLMLLLSINVSQVLPVYDNPRARMSNYLIARGCGDLDFTGPVDMDRAGLDDSDFVGSVWKKQRTESFPVCGPSSENASVTSAESVCIEQAWNPFEDRWVIARAACSCVLDFIDLNENQAQEVIQRDFFDFLINEFESEDFDYGFEDEEALYFGDINQINGFGKSRVLFLCLRVFAESESEFLRNNRLPLTVLKPSNRKIEAAILIGTEILNYLEKLLLWDSNDRVLNHGKARALFERYWNLSPYPAICRGFAQQLNDGLKNFFNECFENISNACGHSKKEILQQLNSCCELSLQNVLRNDEYCFLNSHDVQMLKWLMREKFFPLINSKYQHVFDVLSSSCSLEERKIQVKKIFENNDGLSEIACFSDLSTTRSGTSTIIDLFCQNLYWFCQDLDSAIRL